MSENATCFPPKAPQKGPPLFQHGDVVFQGGFPAWTLRASDLWLLTSSIVHCLAFAAHDVGWIVSGFFTVLAIVTSFWLINKHLQWYTNKREQRYIVRLLLMVPIYASISLASYLFWDNATPLLLIRDAYEAILLTAFFYLLLTYLSPDPEVQKAVLLKRGLSKEADAELRRRRQPRKKWVFPLGFVRWKPQDGLFFLQLMKWGVLQYCVVRPTTTLAAVILNHIGLYCEQSWSPVWGHVWITTLISISVTIAMYCLLQLYICVAGELAPHRPVLKLFAVKAVVFLTFWQATFLSLLSMIGVVKDTPYMTAGDINIGWGAILETFEMSIFACVHIKAFSYKPYRPPTPNPRRTPRLRSFAHAMDFRETFRELRTGLVYMWRRMRGAETDPQARRVAVLENAFDKSREQVWRERREAEKERGLQVSKAVEVDVDVDGERQWLGAGDEFDYGLSRRERSEALGVVVERELEKRGYGRSGDPEPDMDPSHQNLTHEPRQRSWWRSAYERVSQSNSGRDEFPASPPPKRKSRSRHTSRDVEQRVRVYDDQPPTSFLRTYRDSRRPDQDLPPGAQSPQPPGTRTSQDVAGLPTQDRHPFQPTTRASLARADTVLNRLFPNPSVRSASLHSGGTSVVLASLESHRAHLPINAAPAVLAQNVDAGRAVEISRSTLSPVSPVTRDERERELHAQLSYLPIPPPSVQPTQSGLYQGDTGLPPAPPPKSSPRPSHRRESAHYRARLAQADGLTTSPTSTEDRSRHARSHRHGQPDSPTTRYPRSSRAYYDTPLSVEGDAPSPSRRWSTPGTAVPAHIFTPQPMLSRSRKLPRSKGARRATAPVPRDNEPSPSLPPFSESSDYHLYHFPDTRSPPTRHQRS
ncbi:organic solute transporter Ostalpha-domain-containing protein [Lactarius akahatsu]|uniref:Organic solute transporter Ostalpha-domain-containing protein n=1 Tax=Lactarius akahatsu TaxID=416441 RepID=A0AAD4LMU7_9AGAM|nr:organic solute transporter Ostalpha-domain-containing protein [Lactarius akahatsu]